MTRRGDDTCMCGHANEDHRESAESQHGGPCSVCTCNRFDWDIDADDHDAGDGTDAMPIHCTCPEGFHTPGEGCEADE